MKKTTFILGLSLSAILAIAGCANNTTNDQAVIDKLSTQLDKVINTVSEVSVANIDEISREDIGGIQFTSQSTLSGARQPATAIAKNIESNRYQILRKAKTIKKDIVGGDIKLGNDNARAISELTNSMQKYTTELTRTKSDYRNTVRSISKLDDTNTQFDAKLTRLNCCLESRDCYMNNILQSLNNVESILDALDNNTNNNNNNNDYTNTQQDTSESNTKDWGNKTPEDYTNSNSTNIPSNFNIPNYNLPQNYNSNQYNYTPNCPDGNCFNNQNCENGICYNNVAGMNGYTYNRGPFNPNRNTDTYGPGLTNIDTYRFTGNGYNYGYNFGPNNQGMRHFNGSNGVNNIMPNDNFENQTQELVQNDEIEASKQTTETDKLDEENNKKENDKPTEQQQKTVDSETKNNITSTEINSEKKTVTSSEQAKDKTRPQPKKAETLDIETESKIKTVSAQKADDKKQSEENPQSSNLTGEDKVKGHTSAMNVDINKDIKKLLDN